ncbi:ABC transporter ATP-binding protein [Variovorax sp. J31P207]|uniref:ABC transporter ATP-binding protein n=1 Tax=Variovorax sp. J31P207 TaxID=3053510 RepID=UPI0025776C46|nr:ABC transporter ATP-binding protein [Variovorax sp. J31P207]MDM0071606.1 ABC transporter ATP-binding protein [Variovorax sp. J31P207]
MNRLTKYSSLSAASERIAVAGPAPAGCDLQITQLVKRYNGVTAVDGVDLCVPPGKLLSLLGPSGCGKTTILQSIAGFVMPDQGDVRINGVSVLSKPPEKRETAMLFQQYALFPHMTVGDNIGFGPKMQRWSRDEIGKAVREVMELVRIGEFANRYPGQLSGGQKQRVALARALVTRPKVLLLDEPLGALDQNLREAMQVELRKLQQSVGITSLIVTHDQKEAIALSDFIAVMNRGRIEQIGSPLDIYDRPRTGFVARFTGVENLLPVRVLACAGGTADVSFEGVALQGVPMPAAAAMPVGAQAELAVRAESLELAPAGAGVQGTVSFARALGSSIVYEVTGDSGRALTISAHRREGRMFEVGARVGLRFSPSHCALVPAEAA